MPPLRTAILGCGGFARRHAQLFASMPKRFRLTVFCDVNVANAASFAHEFTAGEAQVFTHHHDLFEHAPLDLAAICVPPYGHTDEVERAAERGIHIFIEKPIALTSDHAWRMVAAAEAAGIVTQVGFMYRFGAAIQRLKQLIDRGETGPVGLMSARYFCNSLHADWWRNRDKSGGQLVEQVIQKITAEFADANHADFVYTAESDLRTERILGGEDYYYSEMLDLYAAIVEGRQASTPLREGARSLNVTLAATKSAQTGAVIHLI